MTCKKRFFNINLGCADRSVLLKLSLCTRGMVVCCVVAALSGCAAVVPLESTTKDAEAKAFRTIMDKSNIYVVRTCGYGGKLHDVVLDGGARISLACQTYTVFSVNPGEHKLSAYSTENREMLKMVAQDGKNYFVEMGWRIGSGSGDVKVTVALLEQKDGMKAVRESQLISSDGY